MSDTPNIEVTLPPQRIEDFLNAEAIDGFDTWREWIHGTLTTLEREVDGFSGKRPHGDSGWWWGLAEGLVIIDPKIGTPTYDADGFLDDFDPDRARVEAAWDVVVRYVLGMIEGPA